MLAQEVGFLSLDLAHLWLRTAANSLKALLVYLRNNVLARYERVMWLRM